VGSTSAAATRRPVSTPGASDSFRGNFAHQTDWRTGRKVLSFPSLAPPSKHCGRRFRRTIWRSSKERRPTRISRTHSRASPRRTTSANGVTVDQLAEGVTVAINLAPDGTTTGGLVVPAAGSDTVDLAGRWSLRGDRVTFDQSADTFIRRLPFQVSTNQLRAEGTFGPTTIRVTLSR